MLSTPSNFPRMAGRIKQHVQTCAFCQRNKFYNANTRGTPKPLPIPASRFFVVSLDILSEFHLSNGKNAIVFFTDRLSKRGWIEGACRIVSSAAFLLDGKSLRLLEGALAECTVQ